MYFLPVRSRLNCSVACLLYPPASRPRVHIDVHHTLSLSLSLAILFRFRCTSLRCKCVYLCNALLLLSSSSFSSFSSFSSSSSSLLLLSVIFASRQVVKFDRRCRRQLHKWQMQKRRSVSRALCSPPLRKQKSHPLVYFYPPDGLSAPCSPWHYFPLS